MAGSPSILVITSSGRSPAVPAGPPGVTVEESTGENLNSPTGGTGATVAAVTPGGPAAQAGIQPADVITSVGPQPVSGRVALVAAVRSYAPGTPVTLQLIRGGTHMSVTSTLAPQPAS